MRNKIIAFLTAAVLSFGVVAVVLPAKEAGVTFATYTNGDAATYYNTIDETQSGNTLLTSLRTLNLSKRKSTVGYSSMGTDPSGQFKYTDYDPNYVQYDSNGQPYGTRISSFYTYTSATSWNREHVWPNSHGGGSNGDSGTPYVDADIHMPRPTISSENSSRGNSFFVEGMNHSSNGWDPYTAGYSADSRGEAARITFYCTLVNSKLILAPNNTTPSGTDSVTGQSFGSGHTMGNLETLLKWNINYPVTQREKNRNEGAEYLQGNRNAFVDHPEYACKIWGNVNSTTKSLCSSASWDTDGVSISKSSIGLSIDESTTVSATSTDNSSISWSSSNTNVFTVSSASSSSGANITITAIGEGTATLTASATINSKNYSATCSVTVSSSGGSGGGEQIDTDSYSILPSDLATAYPTTATSYEADSGISFTAYNTANFSSKVQFKKSGGYLYNNSSLNLGTLTLNGVSGSLTVYAGTTRNPSSTTISGSNGTYDLSGYNYFKIINSSSSVATCSSITVGLTEEATLSSISVSTPPTKTTYNVGEYFDPTGLVITRTYSDSTSDTYTYANHTSEFTFSPSTSTALATSNTSVTITYGGKSCNQSITVNAKTLSSISISGQTTSFVEGDTYGFGGTVTAHYSDSTTANVTASATFSGYDMETLGNQTVTVSYGGKSTTYQINVLMGTLSSIDVSGQTITFTKNAAFSFDGTCTATFENGYQKEVTPTSVSSPDMSTTGNKTVTVSLTYNENTKSTTYQITVSQYRTVMEASELEGTITWPSSSTPSISGDVTGLSASLSGKTVYESQSIRLGTGSGGGTLSISASVSITKVKVSAKYYSSSYSSAVLKVDGQSVTPLTGSYADYTVTLTSAKTSLSVLTESSSSRINIQTVTIYANGPETNIGQSDDCVGLETFINSYMHMDYVENLGYCKDSEHHYYSTAKTAFNALNTHQRSLFTVNSAYTAEWTRLSTWASFNGDSLNSSNILALSPKVNPISNLVNVDNTVSIIVIITLIGITSIGGYFYFRRKRD